MRKKKTEKNFIELCAEGKENPINVGGYINKWQSTPELYQSVSLCNYLGTSENNRTRLLVFVGDKIKVDPDFLLDLIDEEKKLNAQLKESSRIQRRVEKAFKNNNYRITMPECCLTCNHSSRLSCEDSLQCNEVNAGEWNHNTVYELGICDKYEKVRHI